MKRRHLSMAFQVLFLMLILGSGCSSGMDRSEPDSAELSPAHVEFVEMNELCDGWEVAVTVRHEDSGWDHYADWWRITDLEGNELAKRVLRHPHVDEQPFTRKLSKVNLPTAVRKLRVEAHCSVHGSGGRKVTVNLSSRQGPGYTLRAAR